MSREGNVRCYKIDLLKLIASFYVVVIHVMMDFRVQNGEIAGGVVFGETFVRCCVPVFFMCSGYVLFQKKKSIKKIYKNLLTGIILPTFCMLLFFYLFNGKIENRATVIECLKTFHAADAVDYLKELLRWDIYGIDNIFYLWYMLSMIKIYIAYPVIALLCETDRKVTYIRRYVILTGFIAAILCPTIGYISSYNITVYWYNIFGDYCFVYLLAGYEMLLLFQKQEGINKKYLLTGIGIYVFSCLINFYSSIRFDIRPDGVFDELFYNYDCLWVFTSAIGLFLIGMNLKISNRKIQNIIIYGGRKTFYLYLLHYPVIRIVRSYGFEEYMRLRMPRQVFYVAEVLLIYFISMALSILITSIGEWLTLLKKNYIVF